MGGEELSKFTAKYNTPCKICRMNISPGDTAYFVKGENGYWCGECEEKRAASVPQAQDAPRLSTMEQGHRENMESARQTRDMIALLVTSVNALQKELSVLVTVLREGKR